MSKFKRINKKDIIDTIELNKNYNFDKNNYIYTWKEANFSTTFIKKTESKNTIYLVCNKRGYSSNICPGKEKFNKDTGELSIYEK